MFHRVHHQGDRPAGQGSITSAEFEELLQFIGLENILSPEEWLSRLERKELRKQNFCLTFDDGLKCQYDVCLPIMEKYNLRGFWFVFSSVFEGKGGNLEIYNSFAAKFFATRAEFYELFFKTCGEKILKKLEGSKFKNYFHKTIQSFPFYSVDDLKFRFIRNEMGTEFEKVLDLLMKDKGISKSHISKDLWLSNLELRNLSEKGHVIGLHSYDHPSNFARLSYQDQLKQYRKNYEHVQEVCKREVVSMAHPINSYNQNTLKVLRKLGIVCGFRSNMTAPEGKKINSNPLELAREDAANILKTLKNVQSKTRKDSKAYASCN